MKPTILYIDEEPLALRANGRRLQKWFGEEVEVVTQLPVPSIENMVEVINEINNLVSVVIDQRLTAKGGVKYLGTNLAKELRQVNQKLPIYILTNYVGDIDPQLGDIEYVLSKDDLADDDRMISVGSRLRRHINVFRDILNEREKRFEELLRKGYESEMLSKTEAAEFKELSFAREKKFLVSDLVDGIELNKRLASAERKLQDLEHRLRHKG